MSTSLATFATPARRPPTHKPQDMNKVKRLIVTAPGGEKKVLLHTCCAPCSSAIVECLAHSGIEPVIFYSNSNIYPREEYDIRREECRRYAEAMGLQFVEDDYDHEAWLSAMSGLEDEPERGGRCRKCFLWRLRRSARYAESHGLHILTTTLASSRWKSLEQIDEAGQWATAPYDDVAWWGQNWRRGGLSERRAAIIREYQFYNQRYCGCEFSRAQQADCTSADPTINPTHA